MIYKFLCFLFLLFVISCASYNHGVEYLEYNYHGSPISRKDDKILIKYIPNKKDIKVELTYHGKFYSRKPIKKKEYQEMLKMFLKIKNEDSALANDTLTVKEVEIVYVDAGASEIIYTRCGDTIKHLVLGNRKDDNKNFYDTSVLIYKNAGLDSKYID
ncbi:hypothetical protein [Chryseobacterium sp. 3008163]|uniref:hypothetical protein n=1 Tax=Chryseobacterium sp. 3008163 TaxID=2478663 RepID=UPI000F0CC959|nr:hypothetical protein [Chryseobacterium sp. 3008163]AYN00260.1 hypothetical protein EAG08_07935 [Chryseobacterium sp. 3008163]